MEAGHYDWQSRGADREGITAASLAEGAASRVDWHDIARLVQRARPRLLALRIVR
jgi:hypothetical protein